MTDDLPEWCVHQPAPGNTRACVWGIHAPDAETAIRTADELVGPLGGWRTGADAGTGAYLRSEQALHEGPRDFTRAVIGGR